MIDNCIFEVGQKTTNIICTLWTSTIQICQLCAMVYKCGFKDVYNNIAFYIFSGSRFNRVKVKVERTVECSMQCVVDYVKLKSALDVNGYLLTQTF